MPDTLPLARLDEVNPLVRDCGRTPWRVSTYGLNTSVVVLDADDKVLCVCSAEIGDRIVGAVNLLDEQACPGHVASKQDPNEQQ